MHFFFRINNKSQFALLEMGAEINQFFEVNQSTIYALSFSAAITCVGYIVINVTIGDQSQHSRIRNHFYVPKLSSYAVEFETSEFIRHFFRQSK